MMYHVKKLNLNNVNKKWAPILFLIQYLKLLVFCFFFDKNFFLTFFNHAGEIN